jgi:quinol monooxygenase YgiN
VIEVRGAGYGEAVLVVTRYRVAEDDGAPFRERAAAALLALTQRPGCLSAHLGRAVDDPTLWTVTTTWTSVGDYRRSLSSYDVKVSAVPLLSLALDEPTAFEDLLVWTPAGGAVQGEIALAADAGRVSLGEAGTPRAPRALD